MNFNWFTVWLLLGMFFIPLMSFAQGRTANWIFGDGYHVKFAGVEPEVLPFIEGFEAYEGASCISDKNGNLLFYSNTVRIWNAHFQPLFNSDTLPALNVPPSSSKTNGTIFLPWPGDSTDRFFAFFQMNDLDNRLYCSNIDRQLDGGLGGILDEFKNVLVWDWPVFEQLSAVKHANGRDWWLIVRRATAGNDEFQIGLLTKNGILNMGSQSTGFRGGIAGELVSSKSGSKLALTTTNDVCFPLPPTIGLYDFDRCSGIIDFIDTIRTRECYVTSYGLAFSESEQMLYYSTNNRISLYQINTLHEELSDTLIFSLSGSSYFLHAGGQLQFSNNSNDIYMAMAGPDFGTGVGGVIYHLAVIREPELTGRACDLDTFGLYLNGRQNSTLSLPNFPNYDLGPLVGSPCDTLTPQDTTQTGIFNHPTPRKDWSVFPTTSSGLYTLQSDQAGWLMVHDLYGREVIRLWHKQTTPFDLTAQPAGLYLVHLRGADGTATLPRKIVRQ
ncbi:MAG: hypothetical protein GC205_01435 [Bacteroidetes bacterium]|nr:hypothetical protein [Bacteroidota bacterium]